MSIKFSIVVPTYNRADLILETLETIWNQSYTNYEVLVVDNCSTDTTETLLAPYAKSGKLTYIRHDKNYERSKSRNTGMASATGDFLTFLDSDDFMYKDCLKDASEFIKANPNIHVFHNKYELVDNSKKPIYQFPFPSLKNQYKALCSGNFIACIGGFISKKIYSVYTFSLDSKMIGSEDYEFWFKILANYEIKRIDKVNCGIRQHPKRSVNQDVYVNLKYQSAEILNLIHTDKVLFQKFGKYTLRLKGSFMLLQAVVQKNLKQRLKAIHLILTVPWIEPSWLLSKRYYAVAYNVLFK